MIWDVHPGSILTFYPSRISEPGVKKAPDPGSGTLEMQKPTAANPAPHYYKTSFFHNIFPFSILPILKKNFHCAMTSNLSLPRVYEKKRQKRCVPENLPSFMNFINKSQSRQAVPPPCTSQPSPLCRAAPLGRVAVEGVPAGDPPRR